MQMCQLFPSQPDARTACDHTYTEGDERLLGILQETPLTPDDLLLMCRLGNLLVSRPTTECISHAEALQEAQNLAVQWLHPTGSPVPSLDNHTSECSNRPREDTTYCPVCSVGARVLLAMHSSRTCMLIAVIPHIAYSQAQLPYSRHIDYNMHAYK